MGGMKWGDAQHARMVSLANEAVLQPDGWNNVVSELGAALGANGGAIFGAVFTPAQEPARETLSACAGSGEDALPGFTSRWAAEDPWFQSVARSGRPWQSGAVHCADELVPPDALFRTAFYNEFSQPHGIENILSLKIIDDDEAFAPATHLSLFQTRRHRCLFGDAQRRALASLWPHLRRAVQAHSALRKARHGDRLAEDALEAIPQPVWVLRDDLAVDHANLRAHELMATASWLRVVAHRLTALGNLDGAALRQAVSAAELGGGQVSAAAVPLDGRLRRACLRIAPLRGVAAYAAAWPHARALLMLELPSSNADGVEWGARLARHYRLTPAERRVLERLSAGLSPREIADEMQVSFTTTRAHLRALHSKTGCHRQAELVRLGLGA